MLRKPESWLKAKNTYKELGYVDAVKYMDFVEEVVEKVIIHLKMKDSISLKINSSYCVTYSELKDTFTLNVPKEKIESVKLTHANKIDTATNILHEMGHIYYKDPKYFTARDKTPVWSKRNRVINALAETRADIFAGVQATALYGGKSYYWTSEVANYKVHGYFSGAVRTQLARMYSKYDGALVKKIFYDIIEADGFITYNDITKSVYHDLRLTKDRKLWMKQVLCMRL